MGMALKVGQMVRNMKDFEKTTKHVVRVNSHMQMEMCMKGIGRMIKLMEKECINK